MSKFKFLFSLLFIVYCANIVCQTNHTLIDCNPVFNYDIPPHVSADPHPCNTPYIAFITLKPVNLNSISEKKFIKSVSRF